MFVMLTTRECSDLLHKIPSPEIKGFKSHWYLLTGGYFCEVVFVGLLFREHPKAQPCFGRHI